MNSPVNTGDAGSIHGWGRSPGEGNGNSVQYSCLGNPMNRGAWQAIAHRVAKHWTWQRLNNNNINKTYQDFVKRYYTSNNSINEGSRLKQSTNF